MLLLAVSVIFLLFVNRIDSAPFSTIQNQLNRCPLVGYSATGNNSCETHSIKIESLVVCPAEYTWDGVACKPTPCSKQKKEIIVQNITTLTLPKILPAETLCIEGFVWDGVQCSKTVTEDPNCPETYNLSADGVCEHIVQGFCPSDYELINGQCLSDFELAVQCPIDYNWNGNFCIHTVPSCPNGYNLSNGVCEKVISGYCPLNTVLSDGKCVQHQLLNVQCPAGYAWNGNRCTHMYTVTCMDGFTLVNNKCVKVATAEPIYVCPNGTKLIGNQCIGLSKPQTPSCPDDYQWEQETHQCTIVPQLPTCLEGFYLKNNICENNSTIVPSCPDLYKYENGKCVSSSHVPLCPDHFNLTKDNWCESNMTIIVDGNKSGNNCPNNICEPITTEPFCHDGYVLLDHLCQNNLTLVPANPVCPDIYEFENGQCVPLPQPPICPTGFIFTGNYCERNQTISPPEPICPPAYKWNDIQCILVPHLPFCNGDFHLIDGFCESNKTHFPDDKNQCAPLYNFVNGLCIPLKQLPDICHGDFVLIDNFCQPNCTAITPKPEIVCPPNSTLEAGQCNPPSKLEQCPDGYIVVNNHCEKIDISIGVPPPPFECPPNKIWKDNQCLSENDCPAGLTWKNNECQLVENDIEVHRPGPPCPEGQKRENGNCVSIEEPPLTTTQPSPVWPIKKCPFGYTQIFSGLCVKTVAKCPEGYVFIKNACYPKETITINREPEIAPRPESDCSNCNFVQHIFNNNTIDQPRTIVINNENNVYLHTNDGTVRKLEIVQKHNNQSDNFKNETTIHHNHVEDIDNEKIVTNGPDTETISGEQEIDVENVTENCCEVITPRQCKQDGAQWTCFHRKYQRCGSFCTQPRIYLRPRKFTYRSPILVLPPPSSRFLKIMSGTRKRLGSLGKLLFNYFFFV